LITSGIVVLAGSRWLMRRVDQRSIRDSIGNFRCAGFDLRHNAEKFRHRRFNLWTGQFGIQWALQRFTDTSHTGCERHTPQRWLNHKSPRFLQ
jgi:hypothetical protein